MTVPLEIRVEIYERAKALRQMGLSYSEIRKVLADKYDFAPSKSGRFQSGYKEYVILSEAPTTSSQNQLQNLHMSSALSLAMGRSTVKATIGELDYNLLTGNS